jgi:hypothetical protein
MKVVAAKTMLDRTAAQFDLTPLRLVGDGGYGSAEIVGWLVDERGIEPHVNLIDKAERTDGTLSRSDFAFDPERNLYVCPGGKELRKYHRAFAKPRGGLTKEGTMRTHSRRGLRSLCAPMSDDPSTDRLFRSVLEPSRGHRRQKANLALIQPLLSRLPPERSRRSPRTPRSSG